MKKRPSVSESSARRKADSNLHNTSRRAQRRRIAARLLQRGSANTLELREHCNSLHPAGRTVDLRLYFRNRAGDWLPSRKGCALRPEELSDLLAALESARREVGHA